MAPLRRRVTFSDLEGHFCCLKHVCPSATVVRVHDGALAEYYAVSSTALVIVDVGWSQLRSIWYRQDWLYGSLLMTRTAYCMLAVRYLCLVQQIVYKSKNCAGSWIKCGSSWKCSSGCHEICLRYSFIRITVEQHFNWHRASRGSLGKCWASRFSNIHIGHSPILCSIRPECWYFAVRRNKKDR